MKFLIALCFTILFLSSNAFVLNHATNRNFLVKRSTFPSSASFRPAIFSAQNNLGFDMKLSAFRPPEGKEVPMEHAPVSLAVAFASS
jgi:hypothetical protein